MVNSKNIRNCPKNSEKIRKFRDRGDNFSEPSLGRMQADRGQPHPQQQLRRQASSHDHSGSRGSDPALFEFLQQQQQHQHQQQQRRQQQQPQSGMSEERARRLREIRARRAALQSEMEHLKHESPPPSPSRYDDHGGMERL